MNVPLVGIAIGEMLIEIVEERESHTGKKLAEILQKAIPAIEKEMEVEIVGLVTDGASKRKKTTKKMRKREKKMQKDCIKAMRQEEKIYYGIAQEI